MSHWEVWRRWRPGDLVVHNVGVGRVHGCIGCTLRWAWFGEYVWCGFVTRLVVCSVDPGLGVVTPHAPLHRGVDVTLPQEQRIAFGELDCVGVCLDVLSYLVEIGFLSQS